MTDSTLSQAIKEAYASAPSDEIIYHTLEIYHEDFTAPIRVVRDYENLTAKLEASAPRDHSSSVEFTAFAFDIKPPDVVTDAMPECVIEIDNVSRVILAQIEAAMSSTALITVIYRAFLSSNIAVGPENDPPFELVMKSVHADVFRIRAVCGFSDLSNKRFPSLEYTSEVFPGLIAQ